MPKTLLKRWNDWSAGVGHLVDDGRTPGMYSSSGLLGLRGELRPAPFKNTLTVGADEGHHYQYFLEETLADSDPTHDADSSGSMNNDTSVTVSHTVTAAQPNTILLVWVFYASSGGTIAVSDIKHNGVDLTLAQFQNFGGAGPKTRLYFLVAPATGSNNIVVNFSTTGDAVVIATSFYHVDQAAPLHAGWKDTGTGTAIAKTGIDSSTSETMLMGSCTKTNTTDTKAAGETLIATVINAGSDMRGTSSYLVGLAAGAMTHTLGTSSDWVSAGTVLVGASPGNYLYGMRGGRIGNTPCALEKIAIINSGFPTLEAGSHTLTSLLKAGQPTRYQAFWWLPTGGSKDPRKLTVAGGDVSADTLASETSGNGDDHLGNLNGQMIGGINGSGYHILEVDGTPTTDADWGSFFPVGDKNERPAAISGLGGASFVLTVEGLFSFNSKARSGLVFEDFRSWRNSFDTIPMPAWKGGLLISHPTGLLFYSPGELPVNIGVGAESKALPPAGVTEFTRGRYMGVHATGEYVWAIYQPDVSSTTVQIQCGYTPSGDPTDLIWQVLGTTTLTDAQHLLGCFVSVQGQPLSTTYSTPVCWFGDGTDLGYLVLDQQAGPFRARADTHKVNISADAYMSELRFTEPVDLTELVVHTSKDMVSGDEFQISLLVNGTGDDIDIGPPVRGSGSRHVRSIDRKKGGKNVTSVVLHVNWTGTSAADRVPPVIQSIELYGKPSIGEAE